MMNLTFGEQVKIILSRKGMTIKELAERVEEHTGKNMSRQNMTQRLGRDNFQEQDMRMIAEILGCSFTLSIMEQETEEPAKESEVPVKENIKTEETPSAQEPVLQKSSARAEEKQSKPEPEEPQGEINPYTGKEYKSNSVRMHPTRLGYVQVYDRSEHKWTDMTEWAFLGTEERKKALLGKDYEPPVYLD